VRYEMNIGFDESAMRVLFFTFCSLFGSDTKELISTMLFGQGEILIK
jgi:hypothetical protein